MRGFIIDDPENYIRDVSGLDMVHDIEFLDGEAITFSEEVADEAEACFMEILTCEVAEDGTGFIDDQY